MMNPEKIRAETNLQHDEVEVIVDGKRKTHRGAAAKMIRWVSEHADFFNSPDVRGRVFFDFAGDGGNATAKVEATPSG